MTSFGNYHRDKIATAEQMFPSAIKSFYTVPRMFIVEFTPFKYDTE